MDLFVRASNMPAIRMYEKVIVSTNFKINALLYMPILHSNAPNRTFKYLMSTSEPIF